MTAAATTTAVLGRAGGHVVFAAGVLDAAEQIGCGAAGRAGRCARRGCNRRGPRRGRGRCGNGLGRGSRSRCGLGSCSGGVQRLDDFVDLTERFPIGEAVGPEVRLCGDLARVVRGHDLRHAQVALIAFAEVDRVRRARVLLDCGGSAGIRRFTRGGVHVRGRALAVDDDGRSAFTTPDLGQTVSDFFVCNRVLSLARRTGNLHNQPRGCAFWTLDRFGKALRLPIPER